MIKPPGRFRSPEVFPRRSVQYGGRARATPLPAIAHWEGDHYVVVARVGRRLIDVMDPAIGHRRLTPAEYLAGATGVTLTFQQTKHPARVATRAGRPAFAAGG
jgi:ATP-binding cassette, subfamily B, bacterial